MPRLVTLVVTARGDVSRISGQGADLRDDVAGLLGTVIAVPARKGQRVQVPEPQRQLGL